MQSEPQQLIEETVKPCPFCGSDRITRMRCMGESWVKCEACGASSSPVSRHEAALPMWNRRACEMEVVQ